MSVSRSQLNILTNIVRKTFIFFLVFLLLFSGFFESLLNRENLQVFASSDWLEGWQYRKEITIDHTKIDDALTHFPVAVILDNDTDFFGELGAGGSKKVAFTKADGTTQLYAELEDYNYASSTAVYYVSKDDWTIASSTATKFYIYYDSSQSDNTTYVGETQSTPAKNVWDSNFKGRWDKKDKTTSSIEDSTSNANHGTKKAANEPQEVDGKIGKTQSYDGSDDFISLGDKDEFTLAGGFTLEAWIAPGKLTTNPILEKYQVGGYEYVFGFHSSRLYVWVYDHTNSGYRGRYASNIDNHITVDEWHYVVATYDGGTINASVSVYVDSVKRDDTDFSGGSFTTMRNTNTPLTMGKTNGGLGGPYQGLMDEVRISNKVRSVAWIKAKYNSGNNTLLSLGSEEDPVSVPTAITQPATSIATTSTTLNGTLTDKGGASSVDVWFRWDTDDTLSDPNLTASSTKTATGTFDYTISDLDSGTTYYFQAVAENSAGIATGTILNFITLPPAPGTPTYDNIATSTLKIDWSSATGTAYYHLERAASTNGEPPSGNFAEIATTTDLYYNDSGLTPNTQYWYRVRAANESGTGAYSSASGQLLYPVPPSEAPTYGGVDHNSIEIFWLAPASGADYYSVERATSTPDTFVEVATTTATTTTDTELSPETTYYYRIKSVNQTGSSSASPYSSTSTGVLLPSVETNSATEITIDSAKLHGNLTDKGGASSVDVWFRWDTDDTLSDPNLTASSTKTATGTFDYTISGLDSGTIYYFQAVAENSAGIATGTILNFITLPPAPGTPTYDNIATSTLKIDWSSATGTAYYHLERAASTNGEPPSGNFAEIATTTDLYYNDSGLTPNTQYWYRVRAANESGTGAYSSASGQLLYPVPPSEAPTYGGVDHNSIEIFWLAPASGADYYSVERATSTPDTFVEVATTTATTTTDTELSPETTYYYRIKSVNQTGSSSASPYSSKTTLEKPIRPPEMESLDYRIWESSINVGGLDYQESTRYRLRETIGEAIAGDATSPSYKLRAGYQPMIDSYITASILVSATPEQVTMSPSIGGVIGGQSNGTTTIKVTTDSSSGYSLFVRASASPAMSTSSYSFADYVPNNPDIPDYNWSVAATTTGFGFTPYGLHTATKYRYSGSSCNHNGGLENKDYCWYNFSTSNEAIAEFYSSNHPDGTETYIQFRAESGNQNIQPAGEYQATIIITAIPN